MLTAQPNPWRRKGRTGWLGWNRNGALSLSLSPTHARTPTPGPEQSHLFFTPKECWGALKPADYSPKQRPGLLPALEENKQPGEAFPKGSACSWFTLFVPLLCSLTITWLQTPRISGGGSQKWKGGRRLSGNPIWSSLGRASFVRCGFSRV